jgi:glycosyltransferase involved in cell wall biosynthesis
MILAGERSPDGMPFVWNSEWPRIEYLIEGWPMMRRGGRWRRRLLFPLLLVRCIRLVQRYQCDAILAVFPRAGFLLTAYLTSLWTGAKLYPYFHNTYVENSRGLGLYFARWLQSRVFAEAEHVFVMSEGMAELYRERYPELQCSPLVHSFNGELPDFTPLLEPHVPLRLLICGSIHENCFDATVRICQAVAQLDDASLTFISGSPPLDLQAMGLLREGDRHETVPHGEVVKRMGEADIVILPHGFTGNFSPEEYRTIFPGRTIEYLLCGRPILAHSPPGSYLTRFLQEQQCALVVDEPSTAALLEAIARLRTDSRLRTELVRNALRAAERFYAPRVAKTLRDHLEASQTA